MFKNIIDKIETFLATRIGMNGIICSGIISICLILLNSPPYHRPAEIDKNFSPNLSVREKLIFKEEQEKIDWCKRNNECSILAEAIVYEARSETELGKASVAHVILNRVKDSRWGDSIEKVVYQPAQFSYTLEKQRNTPSKKDWKSGYLIAFEVLNDLVESPVEEATHYHTKVVSPYWAKHYEVVAVVDSHIFYR